MPFYIKLSHDKSCQIYCSADIAGSSFAGQLQHTKEKQLWLPAHSHEWKDEPLKKVHGYYLAFYYF